MIPITGAACQNVIEAGRGAGAGNPNVQSVPRVGAVRLSRNEIDNTLRDLMGDNTRPASVLLPEDVTDPFDNDINTQQASATLIESVETMASEAASRALADAQGRAAIVGCAPTRADDSVCLRSFVTRFGRRALRRPLTEEEIQSLLGLTAYAVEGNDFYIAVNLAIRVLLQNPEFLYRIETGTAVPGRPGVFRLDAFQVASRLSYFLWGTMPDDALLDAAGGGRLVTPTQVREQAARMLADARAAERVQRFHALWLGYHKLPHPPELTSAMRRETDALIRRIILDEKKPWTELLSAGETYVDDMLARHYGLPPTGSPNPTWVSYGASGRRGILSHGTFLSVAAKFGDTSPTQRGILIRTRLFCQTIPPPPPTVMVDSPPGDPTTQCKYDRYAQHRSGGCASCHRLTDLVGFGLENYDRAGRYRTHDDGRPECTITGQGELDGIGTFRGPAELGTLMARSNDLDDCLVQQVYRFAMAHRPTQQEEIAYTTELASGFRAGGRNFADLLLTVVGAESFAYRVEE